MSDSDVVKKAIATQKIRLESEIKRSDWLSSGSTLFNLACSGNPYGAFAKGKYFWVVGDSSSGKTFLTLTCFAEAANNPNFDNYDLIFDNAEDGALMNVEKFWGLKLANRLQPPKWDDGRPVYSRTVEDFYYTIDSRLKLVEAGKARPFLYLLDSMDSLSSKYEKAKFNEGKAGASKTGGKPKGDFGDGKAKINSRYIRGIRARLEDTGCAMIIVGQTRDKINATMFDPEKQTVGGGRAMKFYASWQTWMSVGRELTKEINGTRRQIGVVSRLRVRKNRLSGKNWTVDVPIYWSVGFDEVGSLVDFLVQECHWGGKEIVDADADPKSTGVVNKGREKITDTKKIVAPEFDFAGPRLKLIRHIEENDLEKDLVAIVTDVWKKIEDACVVHRKRRYN